jgi:hypothetical protein
LILQCIHSGVAFFGTSEYNGEQVLVMRVARKLKARNAVRAIANFKGVHVGIAKAIYSSMSRSQQRKWEQKTVS